MTDIVGSDKKTSLPPIDLLSPPDKILYILLHADSTSPDPQYQLRHSEIAQKAKDLAATGMFSSYIKSSRTYYKKYAVLIDQEFLLKVKEETTGNHYNAYCLTPKGKAHIENFLTQLTTQGHLNPSPPKPKSPAKSITLSSKTRGNPSKQQDHSRNPGKISPPFIPVTPVTSPSSSRSSREPSHVKDGVKSAQSHKTTQRPQRTLTEMRSSQPNPTSTHPSRLSPMSPNSHQSSPISTSKSSPSQIPQPNQPPSHLTDQMLATSLNSAKTIDLLLQNIQHLNTINQQLQERLNTFASGTNLHQSIHSPQQNRSDTPPGPSQGTDDTLGSPYGDGLDSSDEEDFDEDYSEGGGFDDQYIIDQEATPVDARSISGSENPSAHQGNLTITSPPLSSRLPTRIPPTIPKPEPPKTPTEQFQIILNACDSLNSLKSHQPWLDFKIQQFRGPVRQQLMTAAFAKYNITVDGLNYLSEALRVTEQDIADLINNLEQAHFSRAELELLGDRLVQQIIDKTKSSRFALNDVIHIGDQKISYDIAIRNYLKNLFLHYRYQPALRVLDQLHAVYPHLEEDYLILQVKILLNMREYEGLERILQEENVLNRSWKQDLVIFLLFRGYYEQGAYARIAAPNMNFPEKLKELADADYQILHDYDTILTPRKVHKIFTNLIPEFHACPPRRDEMIAFYQQKLREGTLAYFFFAIHFINWVKNYEQNDPRIAELLLTWWEGAQRYPKTVGTYLTIKEEILSELLKLDRNFYPDVNPEHFTPYLRDIQEIRTQNYL